MNADISDVIYSFSETEFNLLASAAGIKELMCFSSDGGVKLPDRAGYDRLLFGLSKRGVIEERDGVIAMAEPYAGIFRCIRDRKFTVHYLGRDEETILYRNGENLVRAVPGRGDNEYIRLSLLDASQLSVILEELLPETLIPADLSMHRAVVTETGGAEERLATLSVFSAGDTIAMKAGLIMRGPYMYMSEEAGETAYDKKVLTERIAGLTEGI
ncbi:MAG: hypothetical protein IKI75_12185 [Lachnospiraceae bacterium]|nr:hypothetical protein [Lachnospiraceae bacterium]